MKLWNAYKSLISRNCVNNRNSGSDGLAYWQNRLFATIMLYLLPLSFFALIPGIIMSIAERLYLLAAFDMLAVLLIALISLSPRIGIVMRKVLFIAVFYLTAIFLLYYLGSFGPGLLYLMATTLFTVLIFPKRIAYFSMFINLLICAGFGIAIHTRIFNGLLLQYSLGSWIAVASNLIILDAVILFLLPMIFKGLQSTITDLQLLKNDLKDEQNALNNTLELLKLKNTELEQFAYMASHDMKEPLRMVSKFLEELEKKYAAQLDDKARSYIHFASDGANRMKKIISDLLEYSVAGKKQDQKVLIDMDSLLKECLAMNQALAGEAQADVTWKDLPVIYAEQMPMQQVFQNLLSNAVKYQRPGVRPRVDISASDHRRYWTFKVTDNGIGIKKEHFEEIFIVFQRLHSREEYEGSGIGLAICKKIIERHNGRIWVESTPGEGTSFIFTIKKPLKSATAS